MNFARQPGKPAVGVLAVAGLGSRPAVNQMPLRYFITRQLEKGWYIA